MSDGTAVVHVPADSPEPPERPESPLAIWQQKTAPCVTSLSLTTDQGTQDYLRCIRGADKTAKEMTGSPVVVRDWFIHEVKPIISDDGEVGGRLRLVWILEDGRTVATRSPSLLDQWRFAMYAAGQRGWRFPMRMQLKATKVDNARSYLEIESVLPCEPTATKQGRK